MTREPIDPSVLGLSIALGYPEQAFGDLPATVFARAEDLVSRARSGEPVAEEAAHFLSSQPEIGEWVAELLSDQDLCPPHLRTRGPGARTRYARLAGQGTPVSAPKYTCPNGDYVWYLGFAGDPIPNCRNCGKELVRVLP
jgi:hypothetical protein